MYKSTSISAYQKAIYSFQRGAVAFLTSMFLCNLYDTDHCDNDADNCHYNTNNTDYIYYNEKQYRPRRIVKSFLLNQTGSFFTINLYVVRFMERSYSLCQLKLK